MPRPRAGGPGTAAIALQPAPGCGGRADSCPHRPRGVRRRRWPAGCRPQGVRRRGIPHCRRAGDPERGSGPEGSPVPHRAGRPGDGRHRARHRGGARAWGDRCRAGLRGAAGDRAGPGGRRGHRCDVGPLCGPGAAGAGRRAGEAGEARSGPPRRPAHDRTRDAARCRCRRAEGGCVRGRRHHSGRARCRRGGGGRGRAVPAGAWPG